MKFWMSLSCLFMVFSPLEARQDVSHWQWAKQHDLPIFWDNIESSPEWVDGVEPFQPLFESVHRIRLEAGQWTVVAVPAKQWLRIRNTNEDLSLSSLQLMRSIDGHTFMDEAVFKEPQQWLTTQRFSDVTWVKLHNTASDDTVVEMGLFTSRAIDAKTYLDYHHVLAPKNDIEPVELVNLNKKQTTWPLSPLQDLGFEVEGPARIRLASRLDLDEYFRSAFEPYVIQATLDNKPLAFLELETGDERRQLMSIDHCTQALARQQFAYIDIPDGKHHLKLSSDARQYVVLLAARGEPDYLFDSNTPAKWAGVKEQDISLWDVTAKHSSEQLQQAQRIDKEESSAARVVRENAYLAGSLAAKQTLMKEGYAFEQHRRLSMIAHQFPRVQNWVDLLPLVNGRLKQKRVIGMTPLSLSTEKVKHEKILWKAQLNSLSARQQKGVFHVLGADQAGLEYRLAQVDTERRVRVFLLGLPQAIPLHLTIQLGNQAKLNISEQIISPRVDAVLKSSDADLARAILYEPIIKTSNVPYWVEFVVPAGIDGFKIHSQQSAILTAVKLQQAKGYVPSERDYLARLNQLDTAEVRAIFFQTLLGDDSIEKSTRLIAGLSNQWRPLMRFLTLQHRYFLSNPSVFYAKATNYDYSLSARIALAKQAQQTRDYVQAIEHWSQAVGLAQGQAKDNLRLNRVGALLKNGDKHLAHKEWWSMILTSRYAAIRDKALASMIRQSDTASVVRLLSALIVEKPSARLLKQLVEALVIEGEPLKALILGLLLDEQDRSVDSLLLAAATQGWWTVFEQLLAQVNGEEHRHYWQGIQTMSLGEYEQALSFWQTGGVRSQNLLKHLQEDLTIRQGMASLDSHERNQAYQRWLALLSPRDADGHWVSAHQWVKSYAGGQRLVLPELGVQQQQFIMDKQQPVTLKLSGSQKIKLLLRPLHSSSSNGSLDDWLIIKQGKTVTRIPVFNNPIDSERQLLGRDDLSVGLRVVQELQLGEGEHELTLNLLSHSALLDIKIWQDVLSWQVLPPIETYLDQQKNGQDVEEYEDMTEVLLADNCAVDMVSVGMSHATPQQVEPLTKVTSLKQHGRLIPDVDQQLFNILWNMQQQPHLRLSFALKAIRLLNNLPAEHTLQSYKKVIRRFTQWKPVNNVENRAGTRRLVIEGARPENPRARVNHVLLAPLGIHQRRLAGLDQLILVLEQNDELELKLTFDFETPQNQMKQNLRLKVQLDDTLPQFVRLNERHLKHSIELSVAAGTHSLSLGLQNPFAGQSVKVSLYEKVNDQWQLYQTAEQMRTYQVASHQDPLILNVQGAGRIRIDEWRKGVTHTHYQWIKSGWQKIQLRPLESQDIALFRVFQLNTKDLEASLPSLIPDTGLAKLPILLSLKDLLIEDKKRPVDSLSLNGQEDGTWSLQIAPTSRRNLNDEANVSSGAENFLETRITHRKYVEYLDLYHRADALYRFREFGGNTLGLEESLHWVDVWRQIDVDLSGSLFMQKPNDALGNQWAAQVNGKVSRLYKLDTHVWHKPSVNLFKRWLSLDELPLIDPIDVDQDIFTDYKRQHLHGVTLCDELTYEPWVDTQLKTGACLNSNEDFNIFQPDRVTMHVGARTLWEDVLWRADYRFTHRFEDENRSTSSQGHKLRFQVDWLRWQTPRHGFQLGVRLDRDMTQKENSLWLTASWHYAKGRYFRDFKPSELLFKSLRQRHHNDRIYGDDEITVHEN